MMDTSITVENFILNEDGIKNISDNIKKAVDNYITNTTDPWKYIDSAICNNSVDLVGFLKDINISDATNVINNVTLANAFSYLLDKYYNDSSYFAKKVEYDNVDSLTLFPNYSHTLIDLSILSNEELKTIIVNNSNSTGFKKFSIENFDNIFSDPSNLKKLQKVTAPYITKIIKYGIENFYLPRSTEYIATNFVKGDSSNYYYCKFVFKLNININKKSLKENLLNTLRNTNILLKLRDNTIAVGDGLIVPDNNGNILILGKSETHYQAVSDLSSISENKDIVNPNIKNIELNNIAVQGTEDDILKSIRIINNEIAKNAKDNSSNKIKSESSNRGIYQIKLLKDSAAEMFNIENIQAIQNLITEDNKYNIDVVCSLAILNWFTRVYRLFEQYDSAYQFINIDFYKKVCSLIKSGFEENNSAKDNYDELINNLKMAFENYVYKNLVGYDPVQKTYNTKVLRDRVFFTSVTQTAFEQALNEYSTGLINLAVKAIKDPDKIKTMNSNTLVKVVANAIPSEDKNVKFTTLFNNADKKLFNSNSSETFIKLKNRVSEDKDINNLDSRIAAEVNTIETAKSYEDLTTEAIIGKEKELKINDNAKEKVVEIIKTATPEIASDTKERNTENKHNKKVAKEEIKNNIRLSDKVEHIKRSLKKNGKLYDLFNVFDDSNIFNFEQIINIDLDKIYKVERLRAKILEEVYTLFSGVINVESEKDIRLAPKKSSTDNKMFFAYYDNNDTEFKTRLIDLKNQCLRLIDNLTLESLNSLDNITLSNIKVPMLKVDKISVNDTIFSNITRIPFNVSIYDENKKLNKPFDFIEKIQQNADVLKSLFEKIKEIKDIENMDNNAKQNKKDIYNRVTYLLYALDPKNKSISEINGLVDKLSELDDINADNLRFMFNSDIFDFRTEYFNISTTILKGINQNNNYKKACTKAIEIITNRKEKIQSLKISDEYKDIAGSSESISTNGPMSKIFCTELKAYKNYILNMARFDKLEKVLTEAKYSTYTLENIKEYLPELFAIKTSTNKKLFENFISDINNNFIDYYTKNYENSDRGIVGLSKIAEITNLRTSFELTFEAGYADDATIIKKYEKELENKYRSILIEQCEQYKEHFEKIINIDNTAIGYTFIDLIKRLEDENTLELKEAPDDFYSYLYKVVEDYNNAFNLMNKDIEEVIINVKNILTKDEEDK